MTDMDPTMARSMLAEMARNQDWLASLKAALTQEAWELRSLGKDCCAQRLEQVCARLS